MAKTIAIVGGSRGLGRAVVNTLLSRDSDLKILVIARNVVELINSCGGGRLSALSLDMSRPGGCEALIATLMEWQPTEVWYFAGGGPYGPFAIKEMKDHMWALQVSFLTPMALLHEALKNPELASLKRLVFIGSDIADSQGDPGAASYAAAKHGLKGLVSSVLMENPKQEIRLLRPGYMDTDLLPQGARPRRDPAKVLDPAAVASFFLDWLDDPKGPRVHTLSSQE